MNTKEFIKAVAKDLDVPCREVEVMLNCMVNTLIQQAHKGERVSVGHLGSFVVKDTPQRIGYDPVRKTRKTIEAKKRLCFKADSKLCVFLNDEW